MKITDNLNDSETHRMYTYCFEYLGVDFYFYALFTILYLAGLHTLILLYLFSTGSYPLASSFEAILKQFTHTATF